MSAHVILDHPVLAAALARHDMTPQDVARDDLWLGQQKVDIGMGRTFPGVPRITVSQSGMRIEWLNIPTEMVFEVDRTRIGWQAGWMQLLTLRGALLPDTVLAAAGGRRLTEVVAMPGAEGIGIVSAREIGNRNQELALTPPE